MNFSQLGEVFVNLAKRTGTNGVFAVGALVVIVLLLTLPAWLR
jgi:hypothetical protein